MRHHAGRTLTDAMRFWPTPVARDDQKSPQAHLSMKARMKGGPRRSITSLEVVVKLWNAPDTDRADSRLETGLEEEAQLVLPMALRSDETEAGGPRVLSRQMTLWSTPRATDGEKGGPHQRWGTGGRPLPSQAWAWATPTARDWRTDSPEQSPQHSPPLGRQVLQTLTAGGPSSPSGRTSHHRLNVTFCEWLIGWPLGWTACAVSETEWCRWSQHMRSALSRLRQVSMSNDLETPTIDNSRGRARPVLRFSGSTPSFSRRGDGDNAF